MFQTMFNYHINTVRIKNKFSKEVHITGMYIEHIILIKFIKVFNLFNLFLNNKIMIVYNSMSKTL